MRVDPDFLPIFDALTAVSLASLVCTFVNLLLFIRYWKHLKCSMNVLLAAYTGSEMVRYVIEAAVAFVAIGSDTLPHPHVNLTNSTAPPMALDMNACKVTMTGNIFIISLSAGLILLYYIQILVVLKINEMHARKYLKFYFPFVTALALVAGVYTVLSFDLKPMVASSAGRGICHTGAAGLPEDFAVAGVLSVVTVIVVMISMVKLQKTRKTHNSQYGRFLTTRSAYIVILILGDVCFFVAHLVETGRVPLIIVGVCITSMNGIFLLLLFLYTEGVIKYLRYRKKLKEFRATHSVEKKTEQSPLLRTSGSAGMLVDDSQPSFGPHTRIGVGQPMATGSLLNRPHKDGSMERENGHSEPRRFDWEEETLSGLVCQVTEGPPSPDHTSRPTVFGSGQSGYHPMNAPGSKSNRAPLADPPSSNHASANSLVLHGTQSAEPQS